MHHLRRLGVPRPAQLRGQHAHLGQRIRPGAGIAGRPVRLAAPATGIPGGPAEPHHIQPGGPRPIAPRHRPGRPGQLGRAGLPRCQVEHHPVSPPGQRPRQRPDRHVIRRESDPHRSLPPAAAAIPPGQGEQQPPAAVA